MRKIVKKGGKYLVFHKIRYTKRACDNVIPDGGKWKVCGKSVSRLIRGNKIDMRYFCPDCTGFFMDRYASAIVPNPTVAELTAKYKYKKEWEYRSLSTITPIAKE